MVKQSVCGYCPIHKHCLDCDVVFGFAASVAPCQMTTNLGSITYFGNKYMQKRLDGLEFLLYLLGKMTVFSFFGLLFWMFGQSVSLNSIPVFVYVRKLVGPLLIIMGLFF
jgi:cytochrome c-type biogenesis protein